ncbi:MAG: cation:proton antiporter [Anaerolineaceae bacterium]|nr:cation:proton antiporter [Anaerolineaceae bacterium]
MEANPVIEFFLALAIVLLVAKAAGGVARRLHQPRVFGELLAGVILGPTLLNFLHWGIFQQESVHLLEENIHTLAELGVLFLMFMVGLEVQLSELLAVGRAALLGGILGAVVPVLLVTPVVQAAGFSTEAALFAGVTLAATSVSISAQTLFELGLLRTKEGSALLAAALIDDVVAILLVSFVVATTGTESAGGEGSSGLILIVVRIAAYLTVAGLVAWFILPRIMEIIKRYSSGIRTIATLSIAAALIFGWSAEVLGGVAAITGAFIAGVGLSRTPHEIKDQIEEAALNIGYALVVPVFFVSVGLGTDLKEISAAALPLTGVIIVLAVLSKLIGVGGGVRLGGFTMGEAFRVGVCMVSRGEVGLIIATLGVTAGVFANGPFALFPPLFLVVLLTTVVTPPIVRWAFRQKTQSSKPHAART